MSDRAKRIGTHWEGCESDHHECARVRLTDARADNARLRALLERAREALRGTYGVTLPIELYDWTDERDATLAAIEEELGAGTATQGNNQARSAQSGNAALEAVGEHRVLTSPTPAPYSDADLLALLELAWGLVANAGGGDWTRESDEWQKAAAKWRETYFFAQERDRTPEGKP